MSRKNDKRERLIEAANELIYQQTFNSTTLADIATKADVPLGNVYYYFKTKDDILKAVLQRREQELDALFTSWNDLPNIKARLKAFIGYNIAGSEMKAKFGCDLGSLCQELGRHTSEIGHLASDLMKKMVTWVESQFNSLGKADKSTTLAEYLLASIQGVTLLTLTFKDPNFLLKQSQTLENWLETV